jgi:putative NIF3 family GTP cyclohydrolase 1 type 2
MPALAEIAEWIDGLTGAARFADQPPTLFVPSAREVRRLGLALEPAAGMAERAAELGLDALFLHRPWAAEGESLPPELGILASHLPFDERLAVGFNPEMAEVLGIVAPEPLGIRDGRPLGMVGDFPARDFTHLLRRVATAFGDPEALRVGASGEPARVAVVGAMTDALVREAAARGAEAYVTGQLRVPAREAVADTGMAVVAIGHRSGELWGLHLLARLVRERWPALQPIILTDE